MVVYVLAWNRYGIPYTLFHPNTVPHDYSAKSDTDAEKATDGHPISFLIRNARKRFDRMLREEATSLGDAAEKYRAARGRHPPPGFDAWYGYATANGALVIESFFDRIYDDLEPFWGTDAYTLQQVVRSFGSTVNIRDGVIDSEKKNSYSRLRDVMGMVKGLAEQQGVRLPDVDVPINVRDEPVMLAPWDNVDTRVSFARHSLPEPLDVITNFTSWSGQQVANISFDPEWVDGRRKHTSAKWFGMRPFWSLVLESCPPKTPGRLHPLLADIWNVNGHTEEASSAAALLPTEYPSGSLRGYIRNWTAAVDVCHFPYLQGLHGAFVAPESMSVTKKIFPLFSSSKISASQEILIPSSSGWNRSDDAKIGFQPWSERENKLFWRGSAAGGSILQRTGSASIATAL